MRRLFCSRLLWTLLAIVFGFAGVIHAGERELLADPDWQQGFVLLKPTPGKRIEAGILRTVGNEGRPHWEVAQWFSRWPDLDSQPKRASTGELRWENGGKTLTISNKRGQAAELTLAIRGSAEFGGKVRNSEEPWPHLLIEQHIARPPSLAELESLRLELSYRLDSSRLNVSEHYDASKHAAQLLIYLHISNADRTSKEYGQYLHFGVPLYDNRHPSPARFFAPDTGGTGMLIFVPAFADFSARSPHDNSWIKIDRDILPLIREGLEQAWKTGKLTDRRELSAYRVTFVTIGWELPGNLDVAATIKGLKLTAVTP